MNIGFSKISITPPLGTKMAGQLLNYSAKGIESELFASAMCMDNGGVKIIFVSCDVLIISNETAGEVCAEIEKATDVPAENVIICTIPIVALLRRIFLVWVPIPHILRL